MKTAVFAGRFLVSLVLAGSIFASAEEVDSVRELKMEMIRQELQLDNLQMQPVGAGDDIMLEGTVSSPETRDLAKAVAAQYFERVFDVLTVQRPAFKIKSLAYRYNPSLGLPQGSRFSSVLMQGVEIGKPWYFLLHDEKELSQLRAGLDHTARANALVTEASPEGDAAQDVTFQDEGARFVAGVQTISLDNGYFRVEIKLTHVQGENQHTLFEGPVYCREGEWVVLTGFSHVLHPDTAEDILLLVQPEPLKQNL